MTEGLTPLLRAALEQEGNMSDEVTRLRHENERLQKANEKLRAALETVLDHCAGAEWPPEAIADIQRAHALLREGD